MSDGPEWFAPKRFGYGTGFPISWQGWAVLIGFIAIIAALVGALRHHPTQLVAAIVPAIATFIAICAKTTKGGWRWRWNGKEEND